LAGHLNSIRVAIVDDDLRHRERIRSLLERRDDMQVVAECSDGTDLLRLLADEQPELVFLDTGLPDADPLLLVEAIERGGVNWLARQPSRTPAFILIAARDEHAAKAFEINAVDFLLDPIDEARFEKALTRGRNRVRQSRENVNARLFELLDDLQGRPRHTDRVVVKSGDRILFLRANEIDWVEAHGNYVRLYARGEQHLLRQTMKRMERQLHPEHFLRIHRSAIVNIDRIRQLAPSHHGDYVATLDDGTRLSVSRVYSDRLNAFIELGGLGWSQESARR
jgi:two-component system LytT family response regulator